MRLQSRLGQETIFANLRIIGIFRFIRADIFLKVLGFCWYKKEFNENVTLTSLKSKGKKIVCT